MQPDSATVGLGLDPDPAQRLYDEAAMVSAVRLLAWPDVEDEAMANARAREALGDWIRLGLPFDDGPDGRRFDFGQMTNFLRREGLEGRDRTFLDAVAPASRWLIARTLTVPPPVGGPALLNPRRYRVRLRREFNLAGHPTNRPARVRLPAPYADPTQTDVEISVHAPQGAIVSTAFPGRVEVKLDSFDTADPVPIDATYAFTAFELHGGFNDRPDNPGLTEAERELWLAEAEGLIRVTASIRALAERLAAGQTSERGVLRAFWDFFLERMRNGYIRHYELDPSDPLGDMAARGWFDCLGAASLFIGLCRARGLPARLVRGMVLNVEAPSLHFWAEVHLAGEGWAPADFAGWDFPQGVDGAGWDTLLLCRQGRRMKCELYPRRVLGPVTGARMPRRWASLLMAAPGGSHMELRDVETGELIYRDTMNVELVV